MSSSTSTNDPTTKPLPLVALIDDNELLLSAVSRWLKRTLGWTRIIPYSDPQEGIDALTSPDCEPIDIMIVDLKMPDINGIEFLEAVQEYHDSAIQILMTGHDFADDIVEAVNRLNLYFFMEKPWDTQKFAMLLGNAWEKKRLMSQVSGHLDELESTFKALKATQSDLQRHKNQAAIGELIQGICHNLNTPLGIVVGHAELLQMRLAQTNSDALPVSSLLSSVEMIKEASGRIHHIIRNLMIKSRMEQVPNRLTISLSTLIQQEMDFLMADPFLKNQVKLSIELAEPIPELWINYADFSQIFGNLMRNAMDAIQGSESPSISIRTINHDERVVLEIHDNGPGVPKQLRSDIFKPFFTTKHPVEDEQLVVSENDVLPPPGVGLGLHSVVQLLEPYGGGIEVLDSELGGACFCVSFSLTSASEFDADVAFGAM